MEKQVPIKFDAKGKPIEYAKIDQASIRKNLIEFIQAIPKAFGDLDPATMETAVERAEQYSSITDVLSKSQGSANPHNVVKATLLALSK